MEITDHYVNFTLWALALLCAVGVGFAVWVS
jgi:hypothetical protein